MFHYRYTVETGCLRAAHLFEASGLKVQPAAATATETKRDKPSPAEIGGRAH